MRLTRFAALRAAILLAVGFVVLRVAYRVLFGGAGGGSGVVLLDLPRIRLSGPFEHIILLGPITSGGLWNAAVSALPFAALVLAIGLLSAIVDLRALLTRGAVRGPLRTVSRALVIAWATFPALLGAVRRVRVARELRGERGAASLVVPVLEQTVERAIALGASMEVRGFAAVRRAEPECEHPAVLEHVSLGYDGRWSLRDVDLALQPGTLTVVTGPTGSGKSTLLHALSGLFQHVWDGDQLGRIEVAGVDRVAVPPRETAGFVGVVPQSVRLSFVAAAVAEELGFTLAIRNVAPTIVRARVEQLADRLGIRHLLDRDLVALSAGEACLVAIGAALIEQPVLLLVDEPLADLDEAARSRIVGLLDRLAHEAGVCVVVAEHATAEWGDAPDSWLALRDGRVHRVPGREPLGVPAAARPRAGGAQLADRVPVAEVRDLTVSHGSRVAVDHVSLTLAPGALVALQGPNGAGKSTLLHALARPPRAGAVFVAGPDEHLRDVHDLHRRERRRAIALVPEAFDDLLFATTVEGECRRADRAVRRAGGAGPGAAELFHRLLGDGSVHDPRGLLARHPRDLSAGERLCLVLAIQLSARPAVLLVDEPSRGLDATARTLVANALVEAADAGAAIVFATHDREFASAVATRTLPMADGRLGDPVEVTG